MRTSGIKCVRLCIGIHVCKPLEFESSSVHIKMGGQCRILPHAELIVARSIHMGPPKWKKNKQKNTIQYFRKNQKQTEKYFGSQTENKP